MKCKWIDPPDADIRKGGWRYCGKRVDRVGSAWCAEHRRRCYVKGTAKNIEGLADRLNKPEKRISAGYARPYLPGERLDSLLGDKK